MKTDGMMREARPRNERASSPSVQDRIVIDNNESVRNLLASVSPLTELLRAHLSAANETTEAAALLILQRLSVVEAEATRLMATLERGHATSLHDDAKKLISESSERLGEMASYRLQREHQIEADSIAMMGLADKVKGLKPVLDLIQGVTEKTNILGLNASIQAATAGEAGLGFAVVAREMRALSSQVRVAIVSIKTSMEQVSEAVDSRLGATKLAQSKVRAEAEWLSTLAAAISRLSENSQGAASELNELASNTFEAVHSIHDVILDVLKHAQFQDITRQQIEQVQKGLTLLGDFSLDTAEQIGRHRSGPLEISTLDEVADALRESYTMKQQRITHQVLGGGPPRDQDDGGNPPDIELF